MNKDLEFLYIVRSTLKSWLGAGQKLRWLDFSFFGPPTPYIDIFYVVNIFGPPTYLVL